MSIAKKFGKTLGMDRLADGNAGSDRLVDNGFGRLVGIDTVVGAESETPRKTLLIFGRSPVVKSVTVTAGGTYVTVTASQTSAAMLSLCHVRSSLLSSPPEVTANVSPATAAAVPPTPTPCALATAPDPSTSSPESPKAERLKGRRKETIPASEEA